MGMKATVAEAIVVEVTVAGVTVAGVTVAVAVADVCPVVVVMPMARKTVLVALLCNTDR